jgi:dienelactone hydrolase
MPTRRLPALLLAAATLLPAQTPSTPPATPNPTDPHHPANSGRLQLNHYLDAIAARNLESRRTTVADIKTRAQAEARQAKVRKQILALLGTLPDRTPLNAQVLGVTQAEGFRMEKILFYSQPNFPVTALLYLPDNTQNKKLPAILIAPGHGRTGKTSDYAFASTFVRNGFAVLSYDPLGQGERLQYPDPAHPDVSLASQPTGEHGEAGLQPVLLGEAVAKYFLWDAIRGLDYLTGRPEIDPTHIGAFGCSGGGVMTALVAALDPRVATAGVACYITSFDALLPAIGPQDGEQSIPNFIAGGPQGKEALPLDFPDWVELTAPHPYAIIATTTDRFPIAGAQRSEAEARSFFKLFNADQNLVFISGPGGHGNLRPIAPQIVSFFVQHLQPNADLTKLTPYPPPTPGATPGALPAGIPKEAFQVTPTGQVATSYPNSETVFSLNLKHASRLIVHAPIPKHPTLAQTQQAIREITHATAIPGAPSPTHSPTAPGDPDHIRHLLKIATEPGITIDAEFYRPTSAGKHPSLLILRDSLDPSLEPQRAEDITHLRTLAQQGTAVLVIAPRPSPPGFEEIKTPIIGDFYLTSLRAQLVGKTILGMRVDDVIRAIDFFSTGYSEDPNNITAQANGHMGLVLLHAAVLDPRLKHITIDHTLSSYNSLLHAPLPRNAPEDILPGVYLRYDIGDLTRALGPRLTFTNPLQGTDDLATAPVPKWDAVKTR